MYGIFLISVLVIIGGAIAFIGDRLGSKIGKKRLSIFGLRPRHTSIVITILTGICITTLTFAVLAAASENVRTALFGMEKLNRSMQDTKHNLQQVSLALGQAQQEQKDTNAALLQSKKEVEKMHAQQASLEERSRTLAEGNRLLELAKGELLTRNNQLVSVNQTLDGKNHSLMQENDTLSKVNGKLVTDNRSLEKRTEELRQGMQIIREGDIIYRAGEIIASGVIRASHDEKTVRADFSSLIQVANRNVSQRLGENTMDKEIWIYQPEYDEAIEQIAHSQQDMVVRIVAAGNLVRGESVRTSLQLYKNSIIYRNNEFILSRPFTMKGEGSGEAERVVMRFLQEVNATATQRGILQDPIRGSIGVMEGSQFYDVVQALTPVRGNVFLSAFANGDTDALGPLRLRVRVEPEK